MASSTTRVWTQLRPCSARRRRRRGEASTGSPPSRSTRRADPSSSSPRATWIWAEGTPADFGVGGAVGFVAGFAEAGGVGGQELRGVAGDGVGEGGDAAFNGDVQVKGRVGVLGFGEFDDDRAAGGAAEGVFVDVPKAEAGKNDATVGGAQFDGLHGDVGAWVAPGPEVEGVGGDAAGDLGEGAAHLVALGGVAGDELVVEVGHGEEGGAGGADVGDEVRGGDEPADFEAFADGELGLPAVGVVDDVGGDVVAGDAAAVELGVDEDVGEDEGVGGLADVNVDGLGVAAVAEEGEPGGGRVADLEGNAAVGLLAEGVGGVGAEEVGGGVAEGGEVEGLVVGHRALPVGGWWTAGEGMVGGFDGGVNFGGEFGSLARSNSFFQKTLEARRGVVFGGAWGVAVWPAKTGFSFGELRAGPFGELRAGFLRTSV